METIRNIAPQNREQWSATTGATSIQLYRNTGDADLEAICGHIALRIYERTRGSLVNLDKIQAVAQWMKNGKHASLILMGNTGTGKTTLAYALADAIAVKNPSPYAYTLQRLERIALEDREWFVEVAKEHRYLLLDDLGTEAREVNDFGTRRNIFNEFISIRYDYDLPVIITTNLNSEMIAQQYGEKTSSRLTEMCDTLLMVGDDLRLKR